MGERSLLVLGGFANVDDDGFRGEAPVEFDWCDLGDLGAGPFDELSLLHVSMKLVADALFLNGTTRFRHDLHF